MSREEALDLLKLPTYDKEFIEHELEFVANKLDITVEILKSYFGAPKKTYKDYKTKKKYINLEQTPCVCWDWKLVVSDDRNS